MAVSTVDWLLALLRYSCAMALVPNVTIETLQCAGKVQKERDKRGENEESVANTLSKQNTHSYHQHKEQANPTPTVANQRVLARSWTEGQRARERSTHRWTWRSEEGSALVAAPVHVLSWAKSVGEMDEDSSSRMTMSAGSAKHVPPV